MKKADFIGAVAKKTGLSKKNTTKLLNATLETITETLQRGESVSFTGFGTFSTTQRAARTARVPSTGKVVPVAAAKVVKFRVGKQLKELIENRKKATHKQQLLDESLKSRADSSTIHAIDTLAHESSIKQSNRYPIPDRYGKERVTLLPVDPNQCYLYWEFTEKLLHDNNITVSAMHIRVVDDEEEVLKELAAVKNVGEYFIHQQFDTKPTSAIAGYYQEGIFIPLVTSNELKELDQTIKLSEDSKEVWIKKERGVSEVIRASMQHITDGISSKSYVDQLEQLREYNTLSLDSMSGLNSQGAQR
jgi:DNA-binding protein HU-beta